MPLLKAFVFCLSHRLVFVTLQPTFRGAGHSNLNGFIANLIEKTDKFQFYKNKRVNKWFQVKKMHTIYSNMNRYLGRGNVFFVNSNLAKHMLMKIN